MERNNKQIHNQMMGRILVGFVALLFIWVVSSIWIPPQGKSSFVWFLAGYLLCMVITFGCSEVARRAEDRRAETYRLLQEAINNQALMQQQQARFNGVTENSEPV